MPNINHAALAGGLPHKAVEELTLGSKDGPTVAAAGSTVADAALLGLDAVIPVTGANGTTGVILNANLPDRSTQIIVNRAAGVLDIYPPTGGSINGLSANAPYLLGNNQAAIIGRQSATAWFAVGEEA